MESDAFPTEEEKAAQLLEFLMAGHDPTAYSIAFIMIEFAKHPNEQTKLRKSLSQLSPESWTTSKPLQPVLKEGMRLHPVGRSARQIGRGNLTSKNETLPKGSLCIAHFLLLFRNPQIFDNLNTFQPSRWEEQNFTREMIDSFHPFSLGKPELCRTIAGEGGSVDGLTAVARIRVEFELDVVEEGRVDYLFTLKPTGTFLKARKVCVRS